MGSSSSEKSHTEAAELFEQGTSAMDLEKWDLALKCLSKAVQLNPEEVEYRKQKHRTSRRKYTNNGKVSKIGGVKLAALKARIKTAELRENWEKVDQLAEDAIAIDPTDAHLFASVADAATKINRIPVAKYAWTSAVKLDKNNAAYFRSFGAVLQADGDLEMAKSCFEKMLAIKPGDVLAQELIQAVDIAAHMDKDQFTTVRNDPQAGVEYSKLPQTESQPLPQENEKLKAFLSLADHHAQRGEFDKAQEAFAQAIELEPEDLSIQMRSEDLELTRLRLEAQQAQKKAQQNPKSVKLKQLASSRIDTWTARGNEILGRRVQENMDDMEHTLKFAEFHRQTANWRDAIPLYQRIGLESQWKGEVGVGLGECWFRTDQLELAQEQLESLLPQLDVETNARSFKLAHYWLARMLESVKDYESAVRHYGEITAIDKKFRDVAKRLKVLNKITWP